MDLLTRFTHYLNSPQNKLSNKTVKNYKADINSFISWYKKVYNQGLESTPANITPQIVKSYKKAKLQESNLSGSSLKRHLSSLRRFFQFLKEETIIQKDPFEQMKDTLKNTLTTQDKWQLQSFKNYLYLSNKSNLTVKNYIHDLRHLLAWVEKVTKNNYVFSKINDTLVSEYKKRLIEHGFSIRTINRKLSSIRQYLKWIATQEPLQNLESPPMFNLEKAQYSSFPPIRLVQKTFRGISMLFDISLIIPIVKFFKIPKSLKWRIKGKPIFSETPLNYIEKPKPQMGISSLPKSFYAPLSISTRYFPLHKKIWHKMRYKRPVWYKKYHSLSLIHYFHLTILVLFISQLVFVINQNITPKPENQKSVLGILESLPPRILTFAGRLTDSSDNPIISTTTPVRMAIYNDQTASGSSLLWQEVININTDVDGKFTTSLGNNTPLTQNLFIENNPLWLGVAVGESAELIPREPIAGTNFAHNTENLQGLSPITNPNANTKNVILALDSSGNLTLDRDANPTFQATGGTFKLLGETLILSTTPGSNTNVEIQPMDLGRIDLQKPIFNSTNNNNIDQAIGAVEINDSLAVLATTSAQSAFVINQNSTGKLISAYTSGTAKFAVDNNGDIISQAGTKWQPFDNSTTALNIANAAGNAFVTFDSTNTRVGIGIISPVFKLDVQDSQSSTAAAQIVNTNTGTDSDGLIVKLGNTSTTVDIANHFISFETSGIGIVGSVTGSGGVGINFRTNGIADFAEYLKKDENQIIEYGSIVCINDLGLVLPCDQTNNNIIGVASDHGGFTGGNDLGNGSIRIGFIGQVYTKVSNVNGPIKPGDPLTASSIPGVAVKAASAGQIAGKAMEGFSSCHAGGIRQLTETDSISPRDSIASPGSGQYLSSLQNDNLCTGKILAAVSVSWYDPSAYIYAASNPSNDLKSSQQKSRIISPIAEIDQIHTRIISPLASAPPTDVQNPQNDIVLESQSSSGSAKSNLAAAVIDSLENASFSGTLDANASSSAIIQDSRFIIPNSIYEGLMAFGPTSLTDVSIIGQLSIGYTGGSFIISENSINTIGSVLEIQPLRQGALSFMGGLVYIDIDGNLKVDGNVKFAKNVTVEGDIIASGSGTFSKLNLSIAKNAFALSSKELISTGSAGSAFVRPRELEITINNNLVTENSLIYITPIGTPSAQTPFLMRQVPEDSFTVGIASPSANITPFNWLIVN